ncbi:DUF305 domain-containing protein [Microbacterium wangchenii]|uniref:DUF305 domain-containing protein n=1 Tax=Microbacterium wangchenii TaxID=2541726 RepID=UPI0021C2AEBC|nr:DUF305 domain-containing protein [Microbacterium wangchenii]
MMTDDAVRALEDAAGVDAARLFLELMIEPHRGATDMAEDEVGNGQHPDAVALARAIMDTQTAEIATMERMLPAL